MDEAVSHSSATSTSNSKADNAFRASIEELFFADYGEIARFYRQLEMRSMANALFLPRTLRCAACCSAPRAALRRVLLCAARACGDRRAAAAGSLRPLSRPP
jgi:hypothetical protein